MVAPVHGPEGQRAAGKAPDARHDARIVRVDDQHLASAGTLEDFGLGVGNRVGRSEEPEVRVADVRPDPDVRLGNRDQRADLTRVIHAQFHDRDVRPGSQLQQ